MEGILMRTVNIYLSTHTFHDPESFVLASVDLKCICRGSWPSVIVGVLYTAQ